jgi:hypothetical protein
MREVFAYLPKSLRCRLAVRNYLKMTAQNGFGLGGVLFVRRHMVRLCPIRCYLVGCFVSMDRRVEIDILLHQFYDKYADGEASCEVICYKTGEFPKRIPVLPQEWGMCSGDTGVTKVTI